VDVKQILLGLILILGSANGLAESRYVTDQFKITLRSGEGPTYRIMRMLSSGAELELLSSNKETGYSQVRTQEGKTGYVLTRQLMPIPVARVRLAEAEKRLKELQEEPGLLSSKLAKLQDAHKVLQQKFDQLSRAKAAQEKELESIQRTANNAIRISNERNDLRKQVTTLTRQAEGLKQENRELSNDSTQKWFLIGAGVIILGIILGLILPHLRFQRRKSSWGSL